jgi:hypothetical protein
MSSFFSNNGLEILFFLSIVTLIFLGVKSKKNLFKHLCFNLAAIFFAFFFYEIYLSMPPAPKFQRTGTYNHESSYRAVNNLLGYGPLQDTSYSLTSTKILTSDSTVVYDVVYTISDGLRLTPNSDTSARNYTIFLGGSFTFGEGVNDDETLPSYYGHFSGDSLNIINYGFHGYGPHQALAIVENRLLDEVHPGPENRVDVFYLFIPDHIVRAGGFKRWDRNGPWYEFEQGELRYKGNFEDMRKSGGLLKRNLKHILFTSAIFEKHFLHHVEYRDSEIWRVLQIVMYYWNTLAKAIRSRNGLGTI